MLTYLLHVFTEGTMNDIIQAVNICIDLFSLSILFLILVLLWVGHWRNDRLQYNFTGMIIAYHGVIITYAIIHFCDGELSAPVYTIVDLVSFVSSALCIYYFSQYVFAFLENRKCELRKITRYTIYALCVLDFLLNVGVDISTGDITRDWTSNETIVSWLATGVWGILMTGIIIYFRKQIGLRTFIFFIIYFILPFIAGSAAPFVEGIRVDIVSVVFVIVCLFVGVQVSENTSHKMFEKLSFNDAMTGLFNRNYLVMHPDDVKRKLPCSYVMFDLNHLKEINDNYGHSKGDEYIRNFAEILKKILPENAEAIRTGGDEFLVIIPKFNRAKCEAFLSRFIEESKQTQVQGITESAAYGFAVRTTGLQSEEEVIAAADRQMYLQKKASREGR